MIIKEESIDAQKRAISYFAKEKGYEIVKYYEDRALSGKTSQRPAFLEMMEDVKGGKIDAVIVHKLDRFSRDKADAFYYEAQLKDNGVELVSVMENLENTPAGNLMRAVITAMNSYYVDNLATEVMKGLKENAYNCLMTGGTPPLGYNFIDKKYVINKNEAKAIQIMFNMYDEGYGYNKIITALNNLGYTTKKGGKFGKNSLYDLFRNERYKGTYVFNKAQARKRNGSRSRKIKPDDEIIRIPNGVPAIIDEAVWERVNAKMDANKRRGGASAAKEQYLLSGLIYCGECGYAMHGNARFPAPNRPKFISYRCNHRDNNLACNNREIKRDDIEGFVIGQLEKYLFNEDIIPTLTSQLNEYIHKSSEEAVTKQKLYAARKSDLEQQKKNIVEAIAKTGYGNIFDSKLQEINGELESIAVSESELPSGQMQITVTEANVREYLGAFRSYVKNRDIPQMKKFIDSYIERVEVFNDRVKVTFKVAFSFCGDFDNCYCFEVKQRRNRLKSA